MYEKITPLIFLCLNIEACELNLSNLNLTVVESLQASGYIDGDFIIGALFPIHTPPSSKENHDALECGPISKFDGIELVEAALFAIDIINNNESFLPGIKLGINIKDDCESELVALYQTINMIKEPQITEEICTKNCTTSPLIGVIGTLTKLNMLHYENLLKLWKIPQIGYSTSLSELISPYFYLSVVPSDIHLAYLIIKLLLKYNWTYISVAYTDEYFGMNGKYFLEQWVSTYNICISISLYLPRADEVWNVHTPRQLFQDDKAKVIVCFCDETALVEILKESRTLNLTGKFLIITSNGWPISEDSLIEYADEAKGMIMLSTRTDRVPNFEKYLSEMKLENTQKNPWREEYHRSNHSNERVPNAKSAYVIKSIFAFAYGLRNMSWDVCGSSGSRCLKNHSFDTTKYMEYLSNLSFYSNEYDIDFSFHGSPHVGKFDIYNLQNIGNTYKFVKVGEYDCHHENLTDLNANSLNNINIFNNLQYPGDTTSFNSICSEKCPSGQSRVIDKEILCCWSCIPCKDNQYLESISKCKDCPEGHFPAGNQTYCVAAEVEYSKWSDLKSLISIGISSTIILLALSVAKIFVKNRHSPVVKSSSAELHYIMLCGVIILAISNFTLIIKPSEFVCFFPKVLPNLAITMIYISVIFKTLQTYYLLNAVKQQNPKLPFILGSYKAQVITIIILVILEAIFLLGWIIIKDERTCQTTYTKVPKMIGYLRCKFKKKHWLDTIFILMHFIMIYYAIKIRKLSFNFHESKFLAIFVFVQTVTNITFRIVYSSSEFQVASMFLGSTLDSFVTLLFLFFPKLYVILWRPEKNNNDNFKSLIERYASYQ